MDQEKAELFGMLSVHYETVFKIPPLASKVFTFLLMDDGETGYTFEELTDKFNVSKSSMSSALNMLIRTDKIEYYQVIDSRKRYFKINPNHLTLRLNYYLESIQKEYFLIKNFQELKQKCKYYRADVKNQQRMEIYLQHLEKAKSNLEYSLAKLAELEEKLKSQL